MATFQLSNGIVGPLSVGQFLVIPNKTYNDKDVPLNNLDVAHSLARGHFAFTDGTDITVVLKNPTVKAAVLQGHAKHGWLGPTNVYGV